MSEKNSSAVLVIGLGNDYRGDDAAGRVVARQLRDGVAAGVCVREESGEGAALMETWKDAELVILVDAVQSGGEPGTVHRLDAHEQGIPSQFFHYSTHAFSVAEAVELARALDQLPPRLVVYGIEGKCFSSGQELSPEVIRAVDEVTERIRGDLQQFHTMSGTSQ